MEKKGRAARQNVLGRCAQWETNQATLSKVAQEEKVLVGHAVKDSLVTLLGRKKEEPHDQNVLVRRPQLGLATPPCSERVENKELGRPRLLARATRGHT